MKHISPFHLAIPVNDLQQAKRFYGTVLELEEGRSDEKWVDYNFFGHQLVVHLDPQYKPSSASNKVDGNSVTIPHFGLVMEWNVFHQFAASLAEKEIDFILEPCIRFKGLVGEQATMFFKDPAGNALEFKTFKDPSQLFKD